MKELVAVGDKLGVKVDDRTAGALALSLQAMRDACKDDATSQVRAEHDYMHLTLMQAAQGHMHGAALRWQICAKPSCECAIPA